MHRTAEQVFGPAGCATRRQWGHSGAPLLDVGIAWQTYRNAIDGLRDVDDYLLEHFHKLRAGQPGDNPFSRLAADGNPRFDARNH